MKRKLQSYGKQHDEVIITRDNTIASIRNADNTGKRQMIKEIVEKRIEATTNMIPSVLK